MSASAAIADPLLRRASGRRARPSDPLRTARVRIGSSGLRAPVSRRGSAISRRTVMNNAGWNWGHMEATSGETNGEEYPGSFLGFACDREWLLGNPSMTGVKSSGNPHERSSWDARSGRSINLIPTCPQRSQWTRLPIFTCNPTQGGRSCHR